jgi:tRNA(Ile)-lysidine synthase
MEKGYNPNISESLARTASVLGRDDEYIGSEARRALSSVLKEKKKGLIALDRKGLTALHEALQVRVFLRAAESLKGDGGLYGCHIDPFLALIKGRRPNACLDLPGLKLMREYDSIILSTKEPRALRPFDKELTVPGVTRVKATGWLLKATLLKKRPAFDGKDGKTAYFDYDAVTKPLRVRSFRAGDRMRPLGMDGRKKLKDLFIDAKVPGTERGTIPLVESGGEVIWAVGLRQAETFKVKKTTRRVLKITSRLSNV